VWQKIEREMRVRGKEEIGKGRQQAADSRQHIYIDAVI
jgi:hypothetical protein